MYDNNLQWVIVIILYSYIYGSVVTEYNPVCILLWIHKNKTCQQLLLCDILIFTLWKQWNESSASNLRVYVHVHTSILYTVTKNLSLYTKANILYLEIVAVFHMNVSFTMNMVTHSRPGTIQKGAWLRKTLHSLSTCIISVAIPFVTGWYPYHYSSGSK